jgi:competence ComEA-like helix-hairpin-helix protein
MFTRDERRAMLFLGAVAAAGGLMRVVRAPAEPPGAPVIAPEIRGGDIARQAQLAREAAAQARPLRPGEVVDVDRASAAELDRLPRVGAMLARRIVDDRDTNGPFGSLEGLSRVPGLGPALLRGLERQVTFSGVARSRESGVGNRESGWNRESTGRGPSAERCRLPTPDCRSPIPDSRLSCPPTPMPLNTASAADLACLPGIGKALAERIVTFRTAHGAFREVKDLQQVPGIGAARTMRLTPLLHAP